MTPVYGKTCDRCGAAVAVRADAPALCDSCRRDEMLARRDTRR